jgi:hypothetical protein
MEVWASDDMFSLLGADDDVKEVPDPAEVPKLDKVMETGKPDVTEQPRRKRGRPRKTMNEAHTVKEQLATETIAGLVEGQHKHKPSKHKTSPFKLP